MNEERYLLRVFGYSATPRLLTSALNVVSFPLLVRALGVSEYGLFAYLSSLAVLLEAFVDFGVSAAAGRALSQSRVKAAGQVRAELVRWCHLQLLAASLGLGLSLIVAWYYFGATAGGEDGLIETYVLIALAVWVAAGTQFTRTVLRSLLAFRHAAIMDTFESVARSLAWVSVAVFLPTVNALAIANLLVVCAALAAGVHLTTVALRTSPQRIDGPASRSGSRISRAMLQDSLRFFGLRLGTRAFQSLPLILIGRTVGLETVGVIAAFGRLSEMVAFPFTVFGNALMLRAVEIRDLGAVAVQRYWAVASRLGVIALAVAGGLFLVSNEVARLMVPASQQAPILFSIMTALFLARAVSDLFAPASDYVGGLGSRIVLLGMFAVLQLPLIWLSAYFYGATGAVVALTAAYTMMVSCYVAIAKNAFHGSSVAIVPVDVHIAALAVLMSAIGALALVDSFPIRIGAYTAALISSLAVIPVLRRNYLTFRLLDLRA